MSSSESWALEKLAELTTAIVGRFGEEAAIQTSFKNLVTLEQSKKNKLQLDLLALQSKYDLLSNKLFIKKWVQDRFMRVVLKAEEARVSSPCHAARAEAETTSHPERESSSGRHRVRRSEAERWKRAEGT
jgi:hypothetical protein